MRVTRSAVTATIAGAGALFGATAISAVAAPPVKPPGAMAPVAVTTGANPVSPTAATLIGTVNPGGLTTTYHYQYGTTTKYGSSSGTYNAGNGSKPTSALAGVSGLKPGTTYDYRLVATNAAGTKMGANLTFKTTAPGSRVVLEGHMAFVSPGNVVGTVIGCRNGYTRCSGKLALYSGTTLIGSRLISLAPESGGFQNLTLNSAGIAALKHNSKGHLLQATVKFNGRTLGIQSLARWNYRG